MVVLICVLSALLRRSEKRGKGVKGWEREGGNGLRSSYVCTKMRLEKLEKGEKNREVECVCVRVK